MHRHSAAKRVSSPPIPETDASNDAPKDHKKRDESPSTLTTFRRRHFKTVADILTILLILGMLVGVLFSLKHVLYVYMSLGHSSTPAAANYRHPAARSAASRHRLVPPDPQIPLPPSAAQMHVFRQAAVLSDSEVCSNVGKRILANRGNAVDATLATLFCNGLVTMQSMGPGGGFVLNIYVAAERRAYTLNARERAPSDVTADMFEGTAGGRHYDPRSIAVPGEVLGYWELHKRFGTMAWKEVLAPTISICRRGFVMSKHMADQLDPRFKTDRKLSQTFVDAATGEFFAAGSLITPPAELCQFYDNLADRGGPDFYNGSLSMSVLYDLQHMGSLVTAQDLRDYRVQWSDSKRIQIGEHVVHVTPPPSSGFLVALMLNTLHGFDWRRRNTELDEHMGEDARSFHWMAETFKWAFAHRMRMGDPQFEDMADLMANLTSSQLATFIRNRIDDQATANEPHRYGATHLDDSMSQFGTSHVSVIAPNGDAISATSSINYYFGCGQMGDRTGLLFNSGLDDFAFPARTNYFDLPPSAANRVAPGKQAVSSMAPIIVTDRRQGGGVRVVAGAAGGTQIPTVLVSILVRLLWWHQSVKQAVDAPRFHHQLHPMVLEYEFGWTEQLVAEMRRLGHRMQRYGVRSSIVAALTRNASGIFGVADYRKRGEVVGF